MSHGICIAAAAARPVRPALMQSYQKGALCRMKMLFLFRLVLAATVLSMLSGCFMNTDSWRYEYRYRVFQSKEEMPSMLQGPIDADLLTQRFVPPAEINKCMDELTSQGFKLWRVEPVPDSPYCTFILRRPVKGEMRPMRAPMEFCGVYEVAEHAGVPTVFYAFQPTYYGYTVVRFEGADDPAVFDTKWDGGKSQLVGDDGQTHHVIVMTANGSAIVDAQEKILPDRLDRKIFTARRVNTGQP